MRWHGSASLMLALLAALAPRHGAGDSTTQQQLHVVKGRVFFPIGQTPPASAVQVTLTLAGGKQLRAYPHADGSFTVQRVPAGAHALDFAALGFVIPSLRVDVASDGTVLAAFTEMPEQRLPAPIHIRAVPVDYFDKVVPFNVVAFLKSPMGLMAVFMLFAVIVLPKLKVDPEEMKEMMAEARGEKQQVQGAAAKQLPAGGQQGQRAISSAQQRGGGSRKR